MSVYNENVFIRQALPGILELCHRVIVVDGSYKGFPTEGLSTDGTLEYLEDIAAADDRLEVIRAHGLDENDKRSLYLKGQIGDWYFMLDADEEITEIAEIQKVLNHTDASTVRVSLTRPYDGLTYAVPRFFKHVVGMSYGFEHWHIFDADGNCLYSHDDSGDKVITKTETYAPFIITHNIFLREQQRKVDKTTHFDYLNSRRRLEANKPRPESEG